MFRVLHWKYGVFVSRLSTLSCIQHELRTPMQGIMGVTEMILQQKKDEDDPVLVESLRLIMASSGLLLNLINNLLDVKKVNSESKSISIVLQRPVLVMTYNDRSFD